MQRGSSFTGDATQASLIKTSAVCMYKQPHRTSPSNGGRHLGQVASKLYLRVDQVSGSSSHLSFTVLQSLAPDLEMKTCTVHAPYCLTLGIDRLCGCIDSSPHLGIPMTFPSAPFDGVDQMVSIRRVDFVTFTPLWGSRGQGGRSTDNPASRDDLFATRKHTIAARHGSCLYRGPRDDRPDFSS